MRQTEDLIDEETDLKYNLKDNPFMMVSKYGKGFVLSCTG